MGGRLMNAKKKNKRRHHAKWRKEASEAATTVSESRLQSRRATATQPAGR